jgi:hypothetical protein
MKFINRKSNYLKNFLNNLRYLYENMVNIRQFVSSFFLSKKIFTRFLSLFFSFSLSFYIFSGIILFFGVNFFSGANLFAQQSGGGYAGSWTSREFSARPLAMSGAFTAIADDPNAIYYNPAGLSNLPEVPTFLSSVSMFGLGRTHSTFAWGQQVMPGLGIGVAFNNLNTGSFTARDITGEKFGEYSNHQYMMAVSASYKIAFASFGTTVKYLTDDLQGSETFANGYSVDFGAMFDVFDLFRFGVQLQNASGFMFWNTNRSDIMNLPWKIKAGISSQYPMSVRNYEDRSTVTGEIINTAEYGNFLTIGFDFSYSQYSVAPVVSLALEYEAHRYLTFRGGMALYGDNWGKPQLFPMNQWGAGLSIFPEIEYLEDNLPFTFSIDYTISNEFLTQSGINHSIALSLNF